MKIGWEDIEYKFGDDEALNQRISFILNEACHVFYHHQDGNWKSEYKPKYANMLANEILKHPSLIRKLLDLDVRVISMITYEAIKINNEKLKG